MRQQRGAAVLGIIAAMSRPSTGPQRAARTVLAASALMLAACAPALNWRSVSLPDAGLTLTLPCKPEHAARPVDLGAGRVDLAMVGCTADGATFAVSHMLLAEPAQAGATLARWRGAVLAGMQASMQAESQGADAMGGAAFVPARALALPQSLRVVARGRGPDGAAVVAHAVWFARLEGAQARLYHAVVYAPQERTDAADAFFAGLALQP